MKSGSFIVGILVGGIILGGYYAYKKVTSGSSWWNNIYF